MEGRLKGYGRELCVVLKDMGRPVYYRAMVTKGCVEGR